MVLRKIIYNKYDFLMHQWSFGIVPEISLPPCIRIVTWLAQTLNGTKREEKHLWKAVIIYRTILTFGA
jgi:hypothetical protein